jgi:UDP-N-acetylmuramoyl-L-alanyl-D-glutamate--2,6-diaminopimelate ligase
MAEAAKTFFGDPAGGMATVGITGTNGKTTTAFLLHHLLAATWKRCGLVGTVVYDTGGEQLPAERTTPESLDLQSLLARMRDEGCRGAVMEVSSHGLLQHRVRDVAFDVAVFTNLSQDHLDYHGSIEDYFAAKATLFEALVEQGGAKKPAMVVNGDDPFGRRLLQRFGGKLSAVSYGMGVSCDFRATDIRSEFSGTAFTLEAKRRSFLVRMPQVGRFNVYNALAALAAGSALGINLRESIANLASAPQVPGRLQSVGERKAFKVFVDYAHTPDALENVLGTVKQLSPRRIITVFGCGGDRDRDKRTLMGRAAERLSDVVIVTSDNPRGEAPGRIIADIEKGMAGGRHRVVEDRGEAIRAAIEMAGARDIVLVAGKGHEDYQEVKGEKIPFDDAKAVVHAMNDLARESDIEREKSED